MESIQTMMPVRHKGDTWWEFCVNKYYLALERGYTGTPEEIMRIYIPNMPKFHTTQRKKVELVKN